MTLMAALENWLLWACGHSVVVVVVTLFLNSPELGSAAPAIPVSLAEPDYNNFPRLERRTLVS